MQGALRDDSLPPLELGHHLIKFCLVLLLCPLPIIDQRLVPPLGLRQHRADLCALLKRTVQRGFEVLSLGRRRQEICLALLQERLLGFEL